ncbi:MAG: hypothetical protein AAFV29_21895, partial [Myxococcota bacterium]
MTGAAQTDLSAIVSSRTYGLRWRELLLVLGATMGCHEQVRLEAPAWTDQKSYILAATTADQTRLWAFDVRPDQPVEGPDLALFGSTDLIAIHSGCPLSVLGLAAGPQTLRAEGLARVPLPLMLGIQRANVDGDSIEPWQTIDADALPSSVTDALRRLDTAREASACTGVTPSLTVTPSSVYEDGRFAFALPLKAGQLLAGSRSGASYLISPDDERQTDVLPEGAYAAGFQAEDETVYLLRNDGYMVYGRFPDGLDQITTSSIAM